MNRRKEYILLEEKYADFLAELHRNGLQQGIRQGIKQCIQRGLKQGTQKRRMDERKETAMKMLQGGLPKKNIEYSGFSDDQIEELVIEPEKS